MSAWLLHMVAVLGPILAETNPQDEGGSGWLLLAGPAAGAAVYGALFRYYRNTDKSHSFERETRVEAQPITGVDNKIDEVRGTRRKTIQGANGGAYRQRVQRVLE